MKLFEHLNELAQDNKHRNQVAQYLLNSTALVINGHNYRLREVEFYFSTDPYTHGHDKQKSIGNWYFHRRGDWIINNSRKGLDITFGHHGKAAGILIRAIESEAGELFYGPSKVVDEIKSKFSFDTLEQLVKQVEGSISESQYLSLTVHNWPIEEVFDTPRIGLNMKKIDNEKLKFIFKNYRYFTKAESITKSRDLFYLSMKIKRNKTGFFNAIKKENGHWKNFENDFFKGMKCDISEILELKITSPSRLRMLYGFAFRSLFSKKNMLKIASEDIYDSTAIDFANDYMEHAVEGHSEDPDYWLTWAQALNQRGHHSAALDAMLTSFYLLPNNTKLYTELYSTSLLVDKFPVIMNLTQKTWEELNQETQLCIVDALEELMDIGDVDLASIPVALKIYFQAENCA
jgi:3-methyladenine DNA glycosylase Mpg